MKGQLVFEFIIAAVLLFAIIMYIINYLSINFSSFSKEFYSDNLENKLLQISEILILDNNTGLVKNWPVLNYTKIMELNQSCDSNPDHYIPDDLANKLDVNKENIKIQINKVSNVEQIKTYTFSDTVNNKAFNGTTLTSGIFDVPVTEINVTEYNALLYDDDIYQRSRVSIGNYYAFTRFDFIIDEDIADITKINITWYGKGGRFDAGGKNGYNLFVKEGGSWVSKVVNSVDNTEQHENITYTNDFSDIITNGKLSFVAQTYEKKTPGVPPQQDIIVDTDLAEVNVTYMGILAQNILDCGREIIPRNIPVVKIERFTLAEDNKMLILSVWLW